MKTMKDMKWYVYEYGQNDGTGDGMLRVSEVIFAKSDRHAKIETWKRILRDLPDGYVYLYETTGGIKRLVAVRKYMYGARPGYTDPWQNADKFGQNDQL